LDIQSDWNWRTNWRKNIDTRATTFKISSRADRGWHIPAPGGAWIATARLGGIA
jgi:hypothetical protein